MLGHGYGDKVTKNSAYVEVVLFPGSCKIYVRLLVCNFVFGNKRRNEGTKCETLMTLVPSHETVHDVLLKLSFVKTNAYAEISIINKLEADSTLISEIYLTMSVWLRTLISQSRDPTGLLIRCRKHVGTPCRKSKLNNFHTL